MNQYREMNYKLLKIVFLIALVKKSNALNTGSLENTRLESYSVSYTGSLQKLNAHSGHFSDSQFGTCNTLCDDFDPKCDCNTAVSSDNEITIDQVNDWLSIIKANAEAAANPILKSESTTTESTSTGSQYVWIGIGISIIVLIGLIVFFLRSRSNNQNQDMTGNYNMQGGAPGMMPGGMPGMPGMPGGMPGMPGGMPGMPGMPGGMPGMPGGMPGMPGMQMR